jgi:hypothetical protein
MEDQLVKGKGSVKAQESLSPKDLTPGKKHISADEKKANEIDLKRQWEAESKKVRGIFRYHECPGGSLSFPFLKYKWDEMITYSMKDGEVYEVPLMVAKHLNTNCWYPSYDYKNDVNGMPKVTLSEKIRRTSFQSLEFVDLEDPGMKSATSQKAMSGVMLSNSALPE